MDRMMETCCYRILMILNVSSHDILLKRDRQMSFKRVLLLGLPTPRPFPAADAWPPWEQAPG